MAHIIVTEPGQVSVAVPLRDGLRAGRHERNDLVLADHRVSRQQIEFSRTPAGWRVKDLRSTHGTFVNGGRIEESHELTDGDRIQVGSVLITFIEAEVTQQIVHEQLTSAAIPSQPDDGANRRLRLVYEVSRAIGALENEDELLGRMLEAILDVLDCDRALVGLTSGPEGSLRRVVRSRKTAAAEEIVLSRAMVEAILQRRQGVILRNAGGRETPHTLVREHILSAMGAPLLVGSRLLGLLYVDDRARVDRFSPQDLEFLTSLGHLTAAALEGAERLRSATAMAEALGAGGPTDDLIGASPPMLQLKAQLHKYGAASANVLIRGESGTGKELIAHLLHTLSPRAAQPFITLNCAAIPESMIESELFGYVKGAFTGAIRDKRGKFTLADRGTLFLDEIGDLDLAAQAKLLRALQEGEIQPLGAEKTHRVNVRVVSATHKDLVKEIAARRFREDLYYRLNVIEVETPPLREREGDLELLAQALLQSSASSADKRLEGFTPAALAALRRHPWPGNVRELRNEMERAAINADGPLVDFTDLSPRLRSASAETPAAPSAGATLAERFGQLDVLERQLVEEALRTARGNLSEASRLLGITRIMLKRRVDRFGLNARDD
ncbi:sigma-54-dependent Fis family transcriptional regulator [Chondromyces apiculatus]|uniref:Two component, sigma54 specific, transcriptional regulator, Fis family n=1 Tax=Chondromyces apiculatus DSM 436 TaxID=1192034 RepID=A0A017T1K7_9BACT|nr:sigma-54-dependent Fis family transcriptional regulator [Chondromyces apiculatus]EYF03088.1 two component, sigma54 specific, transcriptional regulator, Fis family [Chondromyces apiculatus DSM 436]